MDSRIPQPFRLEGPEHLFYLTDNDLWGLESALNTYALEDQDNEDWALRMIEVLNTLRDSIRQEAN
jgi:hypothetical protein